MPDDNPYCKRRVLVLGATGFIGSRMIRVLTNRGAVVTGLVRRRPDSPCGADYIVANLVDFAELRRLVRWLRPSVTFNLAGYGVDPAENNLSTAESMNALLPKILCKCVSTFRDTSWKGQDLVHVGSAQEYGKASGVLAEDAGTHPTHWYGETKLAGTRHIEQFRGPLKAVTARLFTIYGPGEHATRLLPSLISAAATGKPLPLTLGQQRRDFTFVDDVAEGLLRIGLCPAQRPITVNLATGVLTRVRDFAETAAQTLDIPEHNLLFGSLPERPHEMHHEPVAVNRLERLTNWRPSTTIANGISQTIFLSRGTYAGISS